MTIAQIISLIIGLSIASAINFFIFKKDKKTIFVQTVAALISIIVTLYLLGAVHF